MIFNLRRIHCHFVPGCSSSRADQLMSRYGHVAQIQPPGCKGVCQINLRLARLVLRTPIQEDGSGVNTRAAVALDPAPCIERRIGRGRRIRGHAHAHVIRIHRRGVIHRCRVIPGEVVRILDVERLVLNAVYLVLQLLRRLDNQASKLLCVPADCLDALFVRAFRGVDNLVPVLVVRNLYGCSLNLCRTGIVEAFDHAENVVPESVNLFLL